MTTAGPNLPSSGVNDNAVGSTAWSNPGNATTDDATYATTAGTSGAQSNYLKVSGFGFAVPAGATLDGFTVDIRRKSSQNASLRYTYDAVVSLLIGGAVTGNNKGALTTKWTTTDATATYGGAADKWGTTPTLAQVNASNFGVVLSVKNFGGTGATASVNWIKVTVTYTVGGTTYTQTVAGSVTSTGSLKIEVRKTVAGSTVGAGAVSRSVGRGVGGTVTGAGSLSRSVRKGLSGAVLSSGVLTVARTILLTLAGSVAVGGSLARRVGRAVGGSVTGSGVLGRITRKGLSGASGATGAVGRRTGKVISGVVGASGGLTRRTGKGVSGSLSASGLISRLTRRNLSGMATSSGAISRLTRKSLSGSLSASGIVAAIRSAGVFFVNLAGTLTASGALGRSTRKGMTGQTQAQGALSRGARKGLSGSVTPTGALGRIRAHLLSIGGSLAPTGNVTKRTNIEQVGTVQSSGAVVKKISKSLAGILAPIAGLIARLLGSTKPGLVFVGDQLVHGALTVAGARWVVDITDLVTGRVTATTRTVNRVSATVGQVNRVAIAGRTVYQVAISDVGEEV